MAAKKSGTANNGVSCDHCPLRPKRIFQTFSDETLKFMKRFKVGELTVEPGTPLLSEGSSTPQVFTALSGMGLRYKTLEAGERQVISFVMPGDFIGLQAGVMGEMQHSVEATTDMVLCVFNRSALWDLFKNEPQRAYDLTWVAAVEEHFLGETVAALGQRTGTERVAWAMVRLYIHLSALDLRDQTSVPLPYRQQDLADALGLSLVHTNKILGALRRKGLATWKDGNLDIPDLGKLAHLASTDHEAEPVRPLI
jgi:CRP-like cAMP-binding protein